MSGTKIVKKVCLICAQPATDERIYQRGPEAMALYGPDAAVTDALHFCQKHANDYDIVTKAMNWPLGQVIDVIRKAHQKDMMRGEEGGRLEEKPPTTNTPVINPHYNQTMIYTNHFPDKKRPCHVCNALGKPTLPTVRKKFENRSQKGDIDLCERHGELWDDIVKEHNEWPVQTVLKVIKEQDNTEITYYTQEAMRDYRVICSICDMECSLVKAWTYKGNHGQELFCDKHGNDWDQLAAQKGQGDWSPEEIVHEIRRTHETIERIHADADKAVKPNGGVVTFNLKDMEPNRVYLFNWQGRKYQAFQYHTDKYGTQIQLGDSGEGEWEE